jgi:hypothetical protein
LLTLKEAVNKANEIFDLPEGIIAVNSKLVSRYVKDGILPAPEGRAKGYLYSEDFPYHIVTVLVLKRQYSRRILLNAGISAIPRWGCLDMIKFKAMPNFNEYLPERYKWDANIGHWVNHEGTICDKAVKFRAVMYVYQIIHYHEKDSLQYAKSLIEAHKIRRELIK